MTKFDDDAQSLAASPRSLLTKDQILALSIQQAGIGLLSPEKRITCPNRDDSKHQIIGGALGNMVVTRTGFKCVFCAFDIPAIDLPQDLIDSAAGSPALNSPSAENLLMAQARAEEFYDLAESDEAFVMGYLMASSLKQYGELASAAIRKAKGSSPALTGFQLDTLLQLHNAAEPGSEVRKIVIDWLHAERALNPRQHWLEAIVYEGDGALQMDAGLYKHACYRGKQETYFDVASKGFEELKRGMNFVVLFQGEEEAALENLTGSRHQALFEPRDLNAPVKSLKALAPKLERLNAVFQQNELSGLALALQPAPIQSIASDSSDDICSEPS